MTVITISPNSYISSSCTNIPALFFQGTLLHWCQVRKKKKKKKSSYGSKTQKKPFDSLEDKEMNKYNSKKDISWKITSMITEYCHTVRMQPKPMGTIKPEKASWSQQFGCNANTCSNYGINAGEFQESDFGFVPKPRSSAHVWTWNLVY